jgi:hypothetical protein
MHSTNTSKEQGEHVLYLLMCLFSYLQSPSLLSYAINLPEVRQAPKSSEINKKVALLRTVCSVVRPTAGSIRARQLIEIC